MKKIIVLASLLIFSSCAELQQIAEQSGYGVTNAEISSGLKQALEFGIDKEVTKLAEENGFFRNELVRIGLPPELQKVDKTLRDVGLDALADEGLKVLNRAAEDAVSEAIPVFTSAVTQMTITDARNILLGADDAATQYLQTKTTAELYTRFNPIIANSLEKVGATKVWANIIQRYNAIPLTSKVNPDLPDYVTNEALDGVFIMIAQEEKDIRNTVAARTTSLLKRVFALQD
ncbi:MAG: DUF4197 domain-containing protein [Bacteroidota bacterium]|uniref:Uncharacterized protein n=1 Tax=Christiangramia flava JLT2011 TaxID=1229726 RepID=A0A1L7I633_9FLAO|nr:DUF4197 domain-containing protein [Christiangramia flava]APU69036.1 hypothetical protein GRFL_2312 [Christiangramia flava JLT2011]MAM19330.1 DUF4197 domain-containing protein [Christiangramia sp.]MEE2771138.1 DUF4197 domain-containing protein [Bacteroidota bacterium]OSS38490.1 hypothetical protein C723_2473 [Christiangramia flava JLT2011]